MAEAPTDVLLCWSSGKDSAWTLHVLRGKPELRVVGLLTTMNTTHERVAMHAVRRELLLTQAEAAGLPITEVPIPIGCTNEQYDQAMAVALERARGEGVRAVAFGDLYLQDIRRYREDRLRGTGLEPLFPLWGEPTDRLARQMIQGGLRARITCVDARAMPVELCGAELDEEFLGALPSGVDPCGENGEFHSFAFGGPMFADDLAIRVGETVSRDGFVFTDLLPSA